MDLAFVYSSVGLKVSFRIISKLPANAICYWEFGDDEGSAYNRRVPTYTYESPGFYQVTLNVKDAVDLDETVTQTVVVCPHGRTHLQDSIYNLIDAYIPEDIQVDLTASDKRLYITKWQLYIAPLVNHKMHPDDYNNELAYEGLENQLIMELAAWEFLWVKITNLLVEAAEYMKAILGKESTTESTSETEPNTARGDRIKSIQTGPTEVQYFDTLSESGSSMNSSLMKALQPGGVVDELRKNLCTLAARLDIYLPFCDKTNNPVYPPRVARVKKPGPLDVPNPRVLLKKP